MPLTISQIHNTVLASLTRWLFFFRPLGSVYFSIFTAPSAEVHIRARHWQHLPAACNLISRPARLCWASNILKTGRIISPQTSLFSHVNTRICRRLGHSFCTQSSRRKRSLQSTSCFSCSCCHRGAAHHKSIVSLIDFVILISRTGGYSRVAVLSC